MEKEKNKLFNLKEIPNKLLLNIVIYFLTSIGALFLSWFASFKISDLLILSTAARVFLIVGAIFISTAIFLYLLRRKYRKFIPYFKPAKPNFYIIEKELTHQYLEEEKIIHKRRWVLKALRDGLDGFHDKFFWSGERWEWRTTFEDHRVLLSGTRNLYDLYIYQFDRVLKKGDTIEIEVEWTLYGKHKHFFSTAIEEPTDLLKMCISFPLSWKIQKVYCDESISHGARFPNDQKEIQLSRGSYSWQLSNPKLFHYYEIKWNLNSHK